MKQLYYVTTPSMQVTTLFRLNLVKIDCLYETPNFIEDLQHSEYEAAILCLALSIHVTILFEITRIYVLMRVFNTFRVTQLNDLKSLDS